MNESDRIFAPLFSIIGWIIHENQEKSITMFFHAGEGRQLQSGLVDVVTGQTKIHARVECNATDNS